MVDGYSPYGTPTFLCSAANGIQRVLRDVDDMTGVLGRGTGGGRTREASAVPGGDVAKRAAVGPSIGTR
jgi:hypothetical protein